MSKKLIKLGVCILLAGCAPAGSRQQSLVSNANSPAAPAQQLAQQQQQQQQQADVSPAASPNSPFSIGNMLKFVGFQKKQEEETAAQPALGIVLPEEVTQLGSLINEVTGRASQLNVDDAPETTRQKAIGILDTLQQWDGTLAQTQSTGSLNGRTSQLLNSFVGQIREGAQRLVQYVPTPENIAAVKQTASNLHAASQSLGGIMQQVNAIPQAFAGQASANSLLR